VIGESFRNVKGSQCFKCPGYGHVAAHCPSRNLLIKKTDYDKIETVVHEPTYNATDSDDDIRLPTFS